MRYGSVCSGIEAASVAWRPLGWECAFVSEIEKFPSAVLAHRFPEVPNLGDFTKIERGSYGADIDLLVGGTPCQAFSVAGLRKGLEDERGNLALEFARLACRTHARWLVWENVPGVLSSGRGGDFAAFLSVLAGWEVRVPDRRGWRRAGLVAGAPGCYSLGWRVLDAQYTRVPEFPGALPQRRKRVILVGCLGGWARCAEVLFDGEMCGGDLPPRREPRDRAAAGAEGGAGRGAGLRWWDGGDLAGTLTARSLGQRMPDKGQLPCIVDTRFQEVFGGGVAPALLATDYKEPKAVLGAPAPCHPVDVMNLDGRAARAKCFDADGASAYSLTRRRPSGVCVPGAIRKLLPVECERLMGFPDGWTRIPWRGRAAEDCPDGPRYKSLGNSMCVNVMVWTGRRIDAAERSWRDGRGEA